MVVECTLKKLILNVYVNFLIKLIFYTLNYAYSRYKKVLPAEEGDYYLSKKGTEYFTEQYHFKTGYFCESGCRQLSLRITMQKQISIAKWLIRHDFWF